VPTPCSCSSWCDKLEVAWQRKAEPYTHHTRSKTAQQSLAPTQYSQRNSSRSSTAQRQRGYSIDLLINYVHSCNAHLAYHSTASRLDGRPVNQSEPAHGSWQLETSAPVVHSHTS
jgi:hypothetical protein